jgi:hypothetical protein
MDAANQQKTDAQEERKPTEKQRKKQKDEKHLEKT